jgi:hypothetical protein
VYSMFLKNASHQRFAGISWFCEKPREAERRAPLPGGQIVAEAVSKLNRVTPDEGVRRSVYWLVTCLLNCLTAA